MIKEIKLYIKVIKKRIENLVPKEELEEILSEINEIVLKNWVDEKDYRLNKQQILSLVRKHIAKKYGRN